MHGSLIGRSKCGEMHFKWRQCKFAGWILIAIIAGGVVLILLVLLVCCCCCCRRRKRQRKHVHDKGNIQYGELDNPVYQIKPVAATPTPKTNEWRERMQTKYGVAASPSAEADVWNS